MAVDLTWTQPGLAYVTPSVDPKIHPQLIRSCGSHWIMWSPGSCPMHLLENDSERKSHSHLECTVEWDITQSRTHSRLHLEDIFHLSRPIPGFHLDIGAVELSHHLGDSNHLLNRYRHNLWTFFVGTLSVPIIVRHVTVCNPCLAEFNPLFRRNEKILFHPIRNHQLCKISSLVFFILKRVY